MRPSPYAGIALAIVSVSWASIFITWSTSPAITIALYRLGFATLILAAVVAVRFLLDRTKGTDLHPIEPIKICPVRSRSRYIGQEPCPRA